MVAHDEQQLQAAFARCREEELAWTIVGAGTRIVARDGGFSGAIIRLGTGFSQFSHKEERWTAGAGVPIPALAMSAAWAGFSGLEELLPTPGSVGAALMLDPGPGGGFAEIVQSITYLHRGKERTSGFAEFKASGSKAVVLSAVFGLKPDRPEEVVRRSVARLASGGRAVPPSCWLVPPKRAVLREILERAGLSDVRLREVVIPASAPEMLVNLGGGTAKDLALLHQSAIERTRRELGVELQSKISWIGRA